MTRGFIYVLINPSMPGLAKVGKTGRQPANRVAELSAHTGVPTPFVLAYEIELSDCDKAEALVHQALESKGWRSSRSREFFSGPIHQIIATVIEVSGRLKTYEAASDENMDTDVSRLEKDPSHPSEYYFEQAVEYLEGSDSKIKNEKMAVTLFERAVELGNTSAASSLVDIFAFGTDKVRPDLEKALHYCHWLIERGRWKHYFHVALIFIMADQSKSAEKAWIDMFRSAESRIIPDGLGDWFIETQLALAYNYFIQVNDQAISACIEDRHIAKFSTEIAAGFDGYESFINSHSKENDVRPMLKELADARKYFDDCCYRAS